MSPLLYQLSYAVNELQKRFPILSNLAENLLEIELAVILGNPAAAQHAVALIKNGGLPRADPAENRLMKPDLHPFGRRR